VNVTDAVEMIYDSIASDAIGEYISDIAFAY
jgi:hypothetical protein